MNKTVYMYFNENESYKNVMAYIDSIQEQYRESCVFTTSRDNGGFCIEYTRPEAEEEKKQQPVYMTDEKFTCSEDVYNAGYCMPQYTIDTHRTLFRYNNEEFIVDWEQLPLYHVEIIGSGYVHLPKIEDVRKAAIK